MSAAFAACLLLSLSPAGGAASRSSDGRRLAADKSFTYLLPEGFRSESAGGEAARWSQADTGAAVTVSAVPPKQAATWYKNSAYTAAKKARSALKPEEAGDRVFSRVYKKTLKSGLKYYFFTWRKKKLKKPFQRVVGFLVLGGNFYRIEGDVTLKPDGLKSLYAILETFRPVAAPKRKRSFDATEKPSALREQEEKSQGVPLYR